MTFDDTSQTAAQVVTSSTLSLYSLTFLRWYISYDSSLKRCLKDMFLLPLLTCVFPSLTISLFFFPFGLWFKTTSTLSEAAMFNFDTKDFHRLVFKQLASWKKLATTKFEQAQIGRKASASIHKPSQVGCQTRHKQAQAMMTCDDLRSRLTRA